MVITILTGRRPELLAQTLDSFASHLVGNEVIVLHNGGDKPTARLLADYPYKVITTKNWLSNGKAISKLAGYAKDSGEENWLMLEDDWLYIEDKLWLTLAEFLLSSNRVGQVRLRLNNETVLNKNMVTRQPIDWDNRFNYKIGNGHYTNNPAIMKVEDIAKVWPAGSELQAQINYHKLNKPVAQLIPGIFKHIGNGNSLENHKW